MHTFGFVLLLYFSTGTVTTIEPPYTTYNKCKEEGFKFYRKNRTIRDFDCIKVEVNPKYKVKS